MIRTNKIAEANIILKKFLWLDIYMVDFNEEEIIVFTAQEEMNENYKNRFLDNHNGVGDLFTFSAEGVNKGIQYHIVAGGFELHFLSYDSYFPWEINE